MDLGAKERGREVVSALAKAWQVTGAERELDREAQQEEATAQGRERAMVSALGTGRERVTDLEAERVLVPAEDRLPA